MIRLILTFTLLALAGTSAAQTLRQTDENVTSDRYQGQTMKPLAQFTIEGRVTQVKCEFPRQQSDVFIRVANPSSPAQIVQANNLAQRGIDVAALLRLNPEIQSNTTVAAGTVIWLRAREVPALSTDFQPIAQRYFGSRFKWPTVWRFNPEIRDPTSIRPTTRIHLQSAADRTRFGEVSVSQ